MIFDIQREFNKCLKCIFLSGKYGVNYQFLEVLKSVQECSGKTQEINNITSFKYGK
jgi:hypothetical protein